MKKICSVFFVLAGFLVCGQSAAEEKTFTEGALIIPMDLDYQDDGMFEAFGLLYQLLVRDVEVHWAIKSDKAAGGVDFTVSSEDVLTTEAIDSHGYRGGPFVVDASDADAAMVIIDQWQAGHATTAVHKTTESFTTDISRTLTAAPTIGVFADGNEKIAFGYLNAAGIPDSLGQAWPADKDDTAEYAGFPDVLDLEEVKGPSDTDNTDGVLFDDAGLPAYCELMTMHWGEKDRDEAVVAEVREFLYFPTHFFAECQAVNAVENAENGRFLTPNGYIMDERPDAVDIYNPHLPFNQFDGEFKTVGGSEPSYSLPEGDSYFDEGVVMLTEAGSPKGTRDVWMTGYIDGVCDIIVKNSSAAAEECSEGVGKVSYLGGHSYSTQTPISEHLDAQGTRLFLNALFEADCVTTLGQPQPFIEVEGPDWTGDPDVQYQIVYSNSGLGVAQNLKATYHLAENMTLTTSDPAATASSDETVTWELGNMGPGESHTINIDVQLASHGQYVTSADLEYQVGQNTKTVQSTNVTTEYSDTPPEGWGDTDDTDTSSDGGAGDEDGSGGGSSGCSCSATGSKAGSSSLLPLLISLF